MTTQSHGLDDGALDQAAVGYRERLVADLISRGVLRSPPWIDAFRAVPRHRFLSAAYAQTELDGLTVWRPATYATPESYLSAVYADVTVVTKLDDPQPAPGGGLHGAPLSSSTMPGLMAGMLEELGVADEHRVLEIGAGTGYNAALLAHRLGSRNVTSIDVDPALVEAARERLGDLGYLPRLLVADGRDGDPGGAPYDRIIATCEVTSVPRAWIAQTRPGGLTLADVGFGIEGGLVRLTVNDHGGASGRFTQTTGRFIPARALERPDHDPRPSTPTGPSRSRITDVAAEVLLNHYSLRLAVGFRLPATRMCYETDEDGVLSLRLDHSDGSWARVPLVDQPDHGLAIEAGSRRLWEIVEETHAWWLAQGEPDHTRFGLTVSSDGDAHAWCEPIKDQHSASWKLPAR